MSAHKILSLLLACALSYPLSTLANESKISSISYSGYLEDTTLVNISGSNLDTCENLKVGNNSLTMKSQTDSLITYLYGDSKIYDGEVVLICGGKKISSHFSFPYITDVQVSKNIDTFTMSIKGSGLGATTGVEVSGGSFQIITKDIGIVGTLPSELTGTGVSIEASGLKSNLATIPVSIPKITYITAKEGFYQGNEVVIHGSNLNTKQDTKILIGGNYFSALYHPEDQTLSFTLPDLVGVKDFQVLSYGIVSNKIPINILTKKPEITKIEEIDNGSSKQINISGNQFITNVSKVFLNGKELTVGEYTNSNLMILSTYTLQYGINIFEVENNGLRGIVYNFVPNGEHKKPILYSYSVEKVKDNQRYITLSLADFVPSTDTIYFNGSALAPESCTTAACTVIISNDTFIGEFSVGRGDYKNPKTVKFDDSMNYYPNIDYISLSSTIDKDIPIEIHGHNFTESSISSSNFFDSSEKYTITDTVIKGRIISTYDANSSSTFSLQNKGSTSSLTFIGKDLGTSTRIYGPPILKSITSNGQKGIFKSGVQGTIYGENIKSGDLLVLGDNKISLHIDASGITFVIPSGVTVGDTTVKITTPSGQISNSLPITIDEADSRGKIRISKVEIAPNKFYAQSTDSLNLPMYSLKMNNRVKDAVIDQLVFQVQNYQASENWGTFYLKLNNGIVGMDSLINSAGTITFYDLPLVKNGGELTLDLYKKSPFPQATDVSITFNPKLMKISGNDLGNADIEFKSEFPVNKIVVNELNMITCVDSDTNNSYCTHLTPAQNVVTSNPTPSQESSKTQTPENPSSDTGSTTPTKTKIVLVSPKYQSKSLANLANKLKLLAKQIEKTQKYAPRLGEIEVALNMILNDFQLLEQTKTKEEKTNVVAQIKKDILSLKSAIKGK